jgi:hypothetical protein
MPNAVAVERGCGFRKQGGVYFECGVGPGGRPIEEFLFCPPIVLPASWVRATGLTPRGVRLVQDEATKVWHTFDIIGKEYYPNPSDWVEETKRYGMSRRVELQAQDYSKLTAESRHIVLHERAFIDNPEPLFAAIGRGGWEPCPKNLPEHRDTGLTPTMCAALWWECLVDGDPDRMGIDPRTTVRKMPSFVYCGSHPPEGYVPQYRLAIFGSFPISRIVVVKSEQASQHEMKLERVRGAGIPSKLVDR